MKGVVSEAGAYLEKNMSDVLDMAEMSPIKEEEEEEEEKEEEDLQEDGEKHEEEETEKGNTQRRKVRETYINFCCVWEQHFTFWWDSQAVYTSC